MQGCWGEISQHSMYNVLQLDNCNCQRLITLSSNFNMLSSEENQLSAECFNQVQLGFICLCGSGYCLHRLVRLWSDLLQWETFYIYCPFSLLTLFYYFCFILPAVSHQRDANYSHYELKPLKTFADCFGERLIGLNGLCRGETWDVQPSRSKAQLFEQNKCRNCQWSQTLPASPVHQAPNYSQRWTEATFWKEHCSCELQQQASIVLQVSHILQLNPLLVVAPCYLWK